MSNIKAIKLTITSLLCLSLILSFHSLALSQSMNPRVYVGWYSNHLYGFRVLIPKGLRGFSPGWPAGNHELTVNLSQKQKTQSYIHVWAMYDALSWETSEKAALGSIEELRKNTSSFILLTQKKTQLNHLPAVHLKYRFTDKKSGEQILGEKVIAIRPETKGESRIVYEVTLNTTGTRYAGDKKRFEQLLKSWKIISTS